MDDNLSIERRTVSGDAPKSKLTRRVLLPVLTAAVATSTLAAAKPAVQGKQAPASSEAGTIWWNELRTRDPLAMRTFYSGVIGWTPKVVAQDDMTRPAAAGEKSYTLFTMRNEEIAGAEEIEPDDASPRPGWLTYIQLDDVDEAARRALKHGGKVLQQPFDVAGVGRMAEIEDPEGNRIGLVSPRA